MTKKLLLQVGFLLSCLSSIAQTINKTYELTYHDLKSQCVVAKPADSIIFMTASAYSGNSQKMLITKTDADGNVLQTLMIDTPFYDHRLVATDTGVLFASLMDSNLYVISFNNNLIMQWSKQIPVGNIVPSYPYMTVDIEVSHDYSGNEVYYITCAARPRDSNYVNKDIAFSIVKLDNIGQLVWHKTYADQNRGSSSTFAIHDLVHSITKIDSSGNYFNIAGTRKETDYAYSAFTHFNYLFFINIDDNGNIVQNYERVQTADSMPYSPDVVWDVANQTIACTYTETNAGNIPSLPASNINGIGLMTLMPNLQANAGRYYWRYCENEGLSITSLGDTSYMIGCGIYNCDSSFLYNPAFLRINSSTLNYELFAHYNQLRNVKNTSYHVSDAAGNGYMVPYTNDNITDKRLIKVDQSLTSCGSRYDTVDMISYLPQNMPFLYVADSDTIIYNFTYSESYPNLLLTDCDTLTKIKDRDKYKPTDVHTYAPGGIAISVTPTILYDANEQIYCDIMAPNNKAVDIVVYNMTGQVRYRKSLALDKSHNRLTIPAGTMSSGLNMVQIYIDHQPVNSTKVMLAD